MRKRNLFLLALCTLGVCSVLSNQKTLAVSAADWKPGRIIDDVIFQNKDSMSVAQIQQFLDSKVPACDRWGAIPMWSGGPTRAQWSLDNGKDPAPYTCLKEYVENPTTKVNNASDPTIAVPGGLSAAQLIYNAAQAQNINPQVYLVTLQKEQSLVTDDWPYAKQFERATGNNCPDTAPCSPQYAWLWTQVYNSGAQFNYYVSHFDQYNYAPGWNNILYNPNTGCGRQSVFIENAYTAALYIYTPYVPNQAALNNMYGTGDSCSAYGNRNFWRLFNDWFGASITSAYNYSFVTSTPSVMGLEPKQTTTASISIKNMGSSSWYADGSVPIGQHPTRLALKGYENTPYADTSDPAWLGTRNQVKMTPAIVNPGETATFTYRLKGPLELLAHKNYTWIPVVDGVTFMRDIQMQIITFTYAPPFTNVTSASFPTAETIVPNQSVTRTISLMNTGVLPWYADGSVPIGQHPTRLALKGYENTPYADTSDPAWLGTRNQVKMTPAIVNPGETATFTYRLKGPFVQTNRKLQFIPVQDGVTFLANPNISLNITTPAPVLTYSYVSSVNPPAVMTPGSISTASITIKNTGNTVWQNETYQSSEFGRLRLVGAQPYWRASAFADTTPEWLTSAQVAYNGPAVGPGDNATFTFSWKAPMTPGTYSEPLVPILDGFNVMADTGMIFITKVQ